ncbi:MAG TPA: FMN-binding negative transcriptional regulator [Pseudoxanthomonas sp.]|nr:FMN-binding negative transcriptional regulator [Pseudoxanthomonas sp.]
MGHARDSRYAARSHHDVACLLASQPFGWLVSAGGDDACFTPLPLRAELDADGQVVALRGHMARRNPHVARLQRDGHALAMIIGPHAYVSPSWLDDRTQAPSWNYAAVVFQLQVQLSEEDAAIREELTALVTQMEAGRPNGWALAEMGERYKRLATGVTAFRAHVLDTRATFKLGQDEAPHDFAQLLAGLDSTGERTVAAWMRAFAGTAEPEA